VLTAIELNDQRRRWTGEIHNISADRVLPTKPVWESELM